MIAYQEQATGLQLVGDGVVLLLAEGYILGANLAGREYLALLAEADVGDTLIHLGEHPLMELLQTPTPPEMGNKVVLERPFRRVFEVVAQPATTDAHAGDWLLIIRDLAKVRAREGCGQEHRPPLEVVHWPPATPRTSALP